MPAPLTLAVAQPLCTPHDVAANAERHAQLVAAIQARVVVFPELSLTGYHFDAEPLTAADAADVAGHDVIDDQRLRALSAACRETNTIALAGAPVEAKDGTPWIAVLRIDRSGARVVYRKMFLGQAERDRYSPGTNPAVIEVDGWRLGLAVCRDTGVPEHADRTAELGFDIYVAGVLEHADDADVQPIRARQVIDNHGVWVAVASFAGSTGEGFDRAAGGSSIWRPDGTVAASAGPDVDQWAVTNITSPVRP